MRGLILAVAVSGKCPPWSMNDRSPDGLARTVERKTITITYARKNFKNDAKINISNLSNVLKTFILLGIYNFGFVF